jgi:general secretion pathway protein H
MSLRCKSNPAALLSATCGKVPNRNGQAGFTLLEMIVVVTVLAMVGGLVLVKQPFHSSGFNTDATVRALVSGLRLARSRALFQDRDVVVVTEPRGFAVDGGSAWILPPEQALTPARVVFLPDGGSSGGTIQLTAGQRRIIVGVNWLTGSVSLREQKND